MERPVKPFDAGEALVRLGSEAARLQDEALAGRSQKAARARFERSLEERAAARSGRAGRPSRRLAWVGACAAIAAAAAAIPLVLRRSRPISFQVDGEAGKAGEWIVPAQSSNGDAPVPLRFSDGTQLTLGRDAVARVVSAGPRGAEIALPRGHLHASVVHTKDSRWTVGVGPFQVLVTGTEFDTGWEPDTRTFNLDLRRGAVLVTGCGIEPQVVRDGGSVRFRCENGRLVSLTPGQPSAAPSSTARGEPAAPAESPAETADAGSLPEASAPAPAPRVVAPAASTARVEALPPPTWRELAGRGATREAFASALPSFDDECKHASAPDLLTLADLARSEGDTARERSAWLAVRARFPGTAQATTAAFLLGRLAFDSGQFSDAVRWFEAASTESPDGPFARDAQGRLIEAEERAGDHDAARQAAQRYLQKYPAGPHAALAVQVLAR